MNEIISARGISGYTPSVQTEARPAGTDSLVAGGYPEPSYGRQRRPPVHSDSPPDPSPVPRPHGKTERERPPRTAPQPALSPKERAQAVERWLREDLELDFHPFRHLDAGADPHLPSYLVGHEDFQQLWGQWPALLFAPAGGGKTAFRVRLARACREEEDSRRFFPVTFVVPSPDAVGLPPDEDAYAGELLRATGFELLFHLACRPYRFAEWDEGRRKQVRQALEESGVPVDYYLEQMEKAGSLKPLAEAFDQTAVPSLMEPLPESLRAFCHLLRETPGQGPGQGSPWEHLQRLWQFILDILGQEAIFVLVDGADAHWVGLEEALALLEPLLQRARDWADRRILCKFFLPLEFRPRLRQQVLTAPFRVVIINWPRERLVRVLRERLRVASRGMFNSLKAVGDPALPRNVEELLVRAAIPRVPREAIYLAQQVLAEHIRRIGPHGRLEVEDLERALAHYRLDKDRP